MLGFYPVAGAPIAAVVVVVVAPTPVQWRFFMAM